MKQFRFFLSFVILLSGLIISAEACKTTEPTTSTTAAADTTKTAQEKNPIHTNGNVQGGTIMNGPAPANSPTGSKPKQ